MTTPRNCAKCEEQYTPAGLNGQPKAGVHCDYCGVQSGTTCPKCTRELVECPECGDTLCADCARRQAEKHGQELPADSLLFHNPDPDNGHETWLCPPCFAKVQAEAEEAKQAEEAPVEA